MTTDRQIAANHVTTRAQDEAPDEVAVEYEDADVDVLQVRSQFAAARRCLRAFDRFRQLRPDSPMTGYDAASIVQAVVSHADGFDFKSFAVPGLFGADDRLDRVPDWTVGRVQQVVHAIAEATSRDPDDLIQVAAASALRRCNQARTPYRHLARRLDDLRQERILPQTAGLRYV